MAQTVINASDPMEPNSRNAINNNFTELYTSVAADDGSFNPVTTSAIQEDFVGGNNSSGLVGTHGWVFAASGAGTPTATRQANISGRPGIVRLTSGNTANIITYMITAPTATSGFVAGGTTWQADFFVRPAQTSDANTIMRVGLVTDAATNTPVAGAYIEKVAADSSWFGVTRNASTQVRTAALAAVDATNWRRFRIRATASAVFFSLDGGTEVSLSTNLPTGTLLPCFQVIPTTTTPKSLDIDYFGLTMTGLTR